MNGDGHLDLVRIPGELLLGRGDGGFTPGVLPVTLAGQRYSEIIPGDADDDGDTDLYAIRLAWPGPNEDRLFLNDGAGTFSDAGHLHPDGASLDADFADLDGDGRTDLLMGRAGQWGPSVIYLGTSRGFIEAPARLPSTPADVSEVELADVDLDGDVDAVVIGDDGGAVRIALWLNDGHGSFTDAPHQLPTAPGFLSRMAVGDLNGDGAVDIYVSGGDQRAWLNDGAGAFTSMPQLLPQAWGQPTLVDADGDRDLDVLMNSGTDTLYTNDGAASFTVSHTGQLVGSLPAKTLASVAPGDVDGDGDTDILCGYGVSYRMYLNDGTGQFVDARPPTFPGLPQTPRYLTSGDLDGDGDPELVVGSLGEPTRIAWNLGGGSFSAFEDAGPASQDARPFVGDFDGDGDLDLLVGRAKHTLLLNDGCGAWVDASDRIPKEVPRTWAAAAGDLNGDGHVDIYLGQELRDAVLFADGTGGFVYSDQHTPKKPKYAPTTALALGDLDGDGDLDAFFASDPVGRPRLATNLGDGTFKKGPALPGKQNAQSVAGLAMVDVDGDGDLDLVLTSGSALFVTPALNDLWINQGNMTFTKESHRLPPIVDSATGLEVADFDADGHPDLYVPNRIYNLYIPTPEPDSLLLNDGQGFFAEANTVPGLAPLELPESLAATAGDFDGDGDIDVVSVSKNEFHVLVNHTRQLAWARLPRIGRPSTLRITGQPGEHWMLVASRYPNPSTCGLTGLGSRQVVAEGTLPGSGDVLVEVGLDHASTLWRVIYTGRGRGARTLGNYELTVKRGF